MEQIAQRVESTRSLFQSNEKHGIPQHLPRYVHFIHPSLYTHCILMNTLSLVPK